ncbi:hypothetical protein Agub_g12541, partial [Astrephomene gubernaculifera]
MTTQVAAPCHNPHAILSSIRPIAWYRARLRAEQTSRLVGAASRPGSLQSDTTTSPVRTSLNNVVSIQHVVDIESELLRLPQPQRLAPPVSLIAPPNRPPIPAQLTTLQPPAPRSLPASSSPPPPTPSQPPANPNRGILRRLDPTGSHGNLNSNVPHNKGSSRDSALSPPPRPHNPQHNRNYQVLRTGSHSGRRRPLQEAQVELGGAETRSTTTTDAPGMVMSKAACLAALSRLAFPPATTTTTPTRTITTSCAASSSSAASSAALSRTPSLHHCHASTTTSRSDLDPLLLHSLLHHCRCGGGCGGAGGDASSSSDNSAGSNCSRDSSASGDGNGSSDGGMSLSQLLRISRQLLKVVRPGPGSGPPRRIPRGVCRSHAAAAEEEVEEVVEEEVEGPAGGSSTVLLELLDAIAGAAAGQVEESLIAGVQAVQAAEEEQEQHRRRMQQHQSPGSISSGSASASCVTALRLLHLLVKMGNSGGSGSGMQRLTEAAAAAAVRYCLVTSLDVRLLQDLIWALGKLDPSYHSLPPVRQLLTELTARLAEPGLLTGMAPVGLSMVLYGMGKVGLPYTDLNVRQAVCDAVAVAAAAPDCSPQALANMAWGLSRTVRAALTLNPTTQSSSPVPSLASTAAAAAAPPPPPELPRGSLPTTSMTAKAAPKSASPTCSVPTVQFPPTVQQASHGALAAVAPVRIPPGGIAMQANRPAHAAQLPHPLSATVLTHDHPNDNLLVGTAAAGDPTGTTDPTIPALNRALVALTEASERTLPDFKPREMANLLGALAALGALGPTHADPRVTRLLAASRRYVRRRLHDMESRDLAEVLYAYGTAVARQEVAEEAAEEEMMMVRMAMMGGDLAAVSRRTFVAQSSSSSSSGGHDAQQRSGNGSGDSTVARGEDEDEDDDDGGNNTAFWRALEQRCVAVLPGCGSYQVATLVWGFARAGRPAGPLAAAVVGALATRWPPGAWRRAGEEEEPQEREGHKEQREQKEQQQQQEQEVYKERQQQEREGYQKQQQQQQQRSGGRGGKPSALVLDLDSPAELPASQLVRLLWGLARWRVGVPPPALRRVCGVLRRRLGEFDTQALLLTTWALASLGCPTHPVLQALADRLRLSALPSLQPPQLPLALWAVAKAMQAETRGGSGGGGGGGGGRGVDLGGGLAVVRLFHAARGPLLAALPRLRPQGLAMA